MTMNISLPRPTSRHSRCRVLCEEESRWFIRPFELPQNWLDTVPVRIDRSLCGASVEPMRTVLHNVCDRTEAHSSEARPTTTTMTTPKSMPAEQSRCRLVVLINCEGVANTTFNILYWWICMYIHIYTYIHICHIHMWVWFTYYQCTWVSCVALSTSGAAGSVVVVFRLSTRGSFSCLFWSLLLAHVHVHMYVHICTLQGVFQSTKWKHF